MQLFINVLSELHAPQEGKKEIAEKMVEHLVTHDLIASEEIVEQVKE